MKKNKVNLFANVTLLLIRNPIDSIERIQKHLKHFEEITGLKVNWNTSECILVNNREEEIKKMQDVFWREVGK